MFRAPYDANNVHCVYFEFVYTFISMLGSLKFLAKGFKVSIRATLLLISFTEI